LSAENVQFAHTPFEKSLGWLQDNIRARWLPAEKDAWRKIDVLLKQVELLRNEQPRAPAPDEHVH
jgi:hypothetical protein